MSAPIVEYQGYKEPPDRLAMESGPGFVRVMFPAPLLWGQVVLMSATFGLAAVRTAMPFLMVLQFRRLRGMGIPMPAGFLWDLFWRVARGNWVEASVFWILAIFEWWRFRKWGRVPRILTASKEGLALTYLGWFGTREKRWPIGEIKKVELEPVKWNLNWRVAAFYLSVHRVKGWRLRYQLSSRDRELPGQIAAGIKAVMGMDG